MKKFKLALPIIIFVFILSTIITAGVLLLQGCGLSGGQDQTSNSGVKKASVSVQTDAQGHSAEQRNIIARLSEDNKPGAIKHLYVISSYSGQVLIYSTVKGKVTSSNKRLNVSTVIGNAGNSNIGSGTNNWTYINGQSYLTDEVLEDDGTCSGNGGATGYIYWWDVKGIYHQHYISGGHIVHISSQPLPIKSVLINLSSAE